VRDLTRACQEPPPERDLPVMNALFTLGEPQVAGPLAVYPVLGPDPRLAYRAFADAAARGAFAKELDTGASVRELLVENPTDLPLLVYEGEEVLGAQQNRTFDASTLVAAGGRARLPVSCVEQGRWDSSRATERFVPSPQAAAPELRRLKRETADQGAVWGHVAACIAGHDVASPSAAMSDVYDHRRANLADLTEHVTAVPGQLGALAQAGGRTTALDLISRPDVFASLLPRLAWGYALDALHAPATTPDTDGAADFLAAALDAPRLDQPTAGLGRAFGLTAPGLVGGGLDHDDELVQLSAFPANETR
jgi:hypothetical protein